MEMCMKRVYVALSDELLEFFNNMSLKSGQSLSSCVGLALYEYLQSRKALDTMSSMMKLYNEKGNEFKLPTV